MISCLELVEEEKYLFSGSKDNIVMQWDMTTGDCIKSFKGHSGEILFIRKIPGKNKIITAARDYTIKVWDILSGKCVALLSANLQINSLTPVQANGRFAYGTLEGEFKIIDLVNI
jgi:WD40 repeat protein